MRLTNSERSVIYSKRNVFWQKLLINKPTNMAFNRQPVCEENIALCNENGKNIKFLMSNWCLDSETTSHLCRNIQDLTHWGKFS